MVDLNPYGRKGCTCWRDEDARTGTHWYPRASCPFHGVLAEFLPPRNETGTYRVVSADPPIDESETLGYDATLIPAPGWDTIPNEDGDPVPVPDLLPPRLPEPYVCMIKEEERGVLATVRRWARRLGDAWAGDYRTYRREWVRQQRADLDGGEPGTEGRER